MWWLVPIAVGGAAAAIYAYFSDKEKEARSRWENDNKRVQLSIQDHRANIQRHLAEAETSFNFKFLCDLHHSSFRVADEAYRLKRDAEQSLAVMRKMINAAKQKRRNFREKQRG